MTPKKANSIYSNTLQCYQLGNTVILYIVTLYALFLWFSVTNLVTPVSACYATTYRVSHWRGVTNLVTPVSAYSVKTYGTSISISIQIKKDIYVRTYARAGAHACICILLFGNKTPKFFVNVYTV